MGVGEDLQWWLRSMLLLLLCLGVLVVNMSGVHDSL